jgi:hypothetical protein
MPHSHHCRLSLLRGKPRLRLLDHLLPDFFICRLSVAVPGGLFVVVTLLISHTIV